LHAVAREQGIRLHEGVYASVPGPNLETPAEYKFLRIIGADAVGMSTVPEVIACAHMGLPVVAVSVITDVCDPSRLQPVQIENIIAAAKSAEKQLSQLLLGLFGRWEAAWDSPAP
jgi:purine-nucleoside phosphorylase